MSTVPHDQSQRLTASSPDDGACDSFFLSIDNHPTSTIMRPNQSTQQKSRRHVKGALFAEDKTSSENLTLQTHTRNKISDDESQGRDDPLRELPNNALPLIDQITGTTTVPLTRSTLVWLLYLLQQIRWSIRKLVPAVLVKFKVI